MRWLSFALPLALALLLWPAGGVSAAGPRDIAQTGEMPCYALRLSDIKSQPWVSYTCIETRAVVVNVRAKDYDGHEQVHLRLRDGTSQYSAFWPAEQGPLMDGQWVKVRAMLVPLVQGNAIVGWGLLIINWEPTTPLLQDALET
ncbi:MAG: hypothetical protein U0768_01555 [Anaerolineae bacterium]